MILGYACEFCSKFVTSYHPNMCKYNVTIPNKVAFFNIISVFLQLCYCNKNILMEECNKYEYSKLCGLRHDQLFLYSEKCLSDHLYPS